MTAPGNTADDNKARAVFTACLTIGAGFAGLAVAGLVLGFDYLLHGEPSDRERLAQQRDQRRRDRYADALAWLEADRADRAGARAARRDWFNADRDTRGDAPPSGETFGRACGRVYNAAVVGAGRFRRGWQDGRGQARTRRGNGEAGWWRPTREPSRPVVSDWRCPGCNKPVPAPESDDLDQRLADLWCPQCRQQRSSATDEDAQEAPRETPRRSTPTDDVVDAEIVPEVTPPNREVVPVGQDAPTQTKGVGHYGERVDDLRNEVDRTLNTRNDNPSPPRSVLH